MATPLPGEVPGTIQILTTAQAREQVPDLFEVQDGHRYFNKQKANGHARWVDRWPALIVVVRNAQGQVVMAASATGWHLTNCGYEPPTDTAGPAST